MLFTHRIGFGSNQDSKEISNPDCGDNMKSVEYVPLSVSSGISQTNVTSTPDSRGVAIGLRVNGVPCNVKLPLDRDHISPPNPEFNIIGKYTSPEVTLASLILISTNGIFPVTFPLESSEPHLKVNPASCVGFEKSKLLTKTV